MTKNCYIHIPFCKKKCNYCAFVSSPCLERITGYMYSLYKEISEKYAGEELETLYIGGGTPSLLPIDLLSKLIKKFRLANGAEVTIEVNPDDITFELIDSYKALGINRVSMGIQSLDDDVLRVIGRRHNSTTALKAVQTILDSDINNLSLDFIYGLPGQSLENFRKDLSSIIDIDVKHISLYGLKIEENTVFDKFPPDDLPDDDVQADMYLWACDFLRKKGFEQYEISNFAKPGFQSRHNLNYWDNNSYYGFGVAAHGYVDGFRYYNTSGLNEYLESPSVSEYAHHVTSQEAYEEEIFLGLRKVKGINLDVLKNKFNIDFYSEKQEVLKKYLGEYLLLEDGFLRFTTQGFLLSNEILSELI